MKTNKKALIICLVFIVIFSQIKLVSEARAVEPCFNSIPDTAWENGEPTEVKSQLNYDLVGTSTQTYQSNQNFRIWDWLNSDSGQLVNTFKYIYEGKSCSKRTILIKKILFLTAPNILNEDELILILKSKAKNFVEEQQRLEALKKAITHLSIKNRLIARQQLSKDKYLVRFVFTTEFTQPIFELVNVSAGDATTGIIPQLTTRECSFYRGNSNDDPKKSQFLQVSLLTLGFGSTNLCNLSWYWFDNQNNLFKLGETTILRDYSILCVKGKSKKVVTGIAPTCPKGFIKT